MHCPRKGGAQRSQKYHVTSCRTDDGGVPQHALMEIFSTAQVQAGRQCSPQARAPGNTQTGDCSAHGRVRHTIRPHCAACTAVGWDGRHLRASGHTECSQQFPDEASHSTLPARQPQNTGAHTRRPRVHGTQRR